MFKCFHRPPSSSVHIFDTLENVIFNLDHSSLSNLILLGDFNVDFHPLSTHPMYSHLCSLTDSLSLMQVVSSNTHVGANASESLIDLVFMSSPTALIECCVTPGLGNPDHYGIPLLLRSSLPAQHIRPNTNRTIWRYAHADFDLACNMLDDLNLDTIFVENCIEECWNRWKEAFLSIMDKCIPKVNTR